MGGMDDFERCKVLVLQAMESRDNAGPALGDVGGKGPSSKKKMITDDGEDEEVDRGDFDVHVYRHLLLTSAVHHSGTQTMDFRIENVPHRG